jgi:hypothetical protein
MTAVGAGVGMSVGVGVAVIVGVGVSVGAIVGVGVGIWVGVGVGSSSAKALAENNVGNNKLLTKDSTKTRENIFFIQLFFQTFIFTLFFYFCQVLYLARLFFDLFLLQFNLTRTFLTCPPYSVRNYKHR